MEFRHVARIPVPAERLPAVLNALGIPADAEILDLRFNAWTGLVLYLEHPTLPALYPFHDPMTVTLDMWPDTHAVDGVQEGERDADS